MNVMKQSLSGSQPRRLLIAAVLSLALAAATAVVAQPAQAASSGLGKITNFRIVSFKTNVPIGVVAASDGSVWYTTNVASGNPLPGGPRETIGRIDPTGSIVEANTPTFSSFPEKLTVGPDGAIWFTEPSAGQIGRAVFVGGQIQITEFRVTDGVTFGGGIFGIVTGSDGNLWMADGGISVIWRYNIAANTFTAFSLAGGSGPHDIAAGPDGNLWIPDSFVNAAGQLVGGIARMTTAGVVTHFDALGEPFSIVSGPGGALWFVEHFGGKRLGRITTAGAVSYPTLAPALPASLPFELAADNTHGKLYVTDFNAGLVTQVNVAGGVEPFPTASTKPRAGSQPRGITVDGAGDVWWAQSGTNTIAMLNLTF
jgi:virginiamycin B lyase